MDKWEELREEIQVMRDHHEITARNPVIHRDTRRRGEALARLCDQILAAMDRYDNNEEGALK